MQRVEKFGCLERILTEDCRRKVAIKGSIAAAKGVFNNKERLFCSSMIAELRTSLVKLNVMWNALLYGYET